MQLGTDVSRPMQRIAMDIVGPFPETRRGNRYILVIGDYFTKWKEAFPIKDMEAATVARCLVDEVIRFCRLGVPDTIHTDQGKNFDSALIKEICELLGIKKTRTSPYHPQSDGRVERFNRTLLNMLSIAVEDDELSWDLRLPTILLAYRTSIHETTGVTPCELMFGQEPRIPEDVMFPNPDGSLTSANSSPKKYVDVLRARLSKAYERVRSYSKKKQQHQKQYYDRDARGSPYQVGDIVSLHDPVVKRGHSRKFHRLWKGPYKVVIIGPTVYRIQDCKNTRKRKVVHFNRLKPAYYEHTPATESPPPDKVSDTNSSETTNVAPAPPNVSESDPGDDPDYIVYLPSHTEPSPRQVQPSPQQVQPRRSSRMRRPPVRYGDPISIPDSVTVPILED